MTCNTTDECSCDDTTGSIAGTDLKNATFDLEDQLDENTHIDNGTQNCTSSSGVLTITNGNGDKLVLQLTGPNCRVPDDNWSLISASYGVTSGTGKFANAIGTGTLSRNKHLTDNSTAVNLVGNISLNP